MSVYYVSILLVYYIQWQKFPGSPEYDPMASHLVHLSPVTPESRQLQDPLTLLQVGLYPLQSHTVGGRDRGGGEGGMEMVEREGGRGRERGRERGGGEGGSLYLNSSCHFLVLHRNLQHNSRNSSLHVITNINGCVQWVWPHTNQ